MHRHQTVLAGGTRSARQAVQSAAAGVPAPAGDGQQAVPGAQAGEQRGRDGVRAADQLAPHQRRLGTHDLRHHLRRSMYWAASCGRPWQ